MDNLPNTRSIQLQRAEFYSPLFEELWRFETINQNLTDIYQGVGKTTLKSKTVHYLKRMGHSEWR